ncbi:MAG: signal peptide peptidase SppA [Candidatus Krumholzibacteriia bacterium]
MKTFWKCFFATILAFAVVAFIVVGMVASKSEGKKKVENHSYLVVDIYGEIAEYDPPAGIMAEVMGGKPETLQRVLGNLEKAAIDKKIDGVIFKISSSNGAGLAMLEEMRGAIKKVRAAGKKVYAYTDSMDRNAFYLAAACDSIYAPPPAYITFLGMSAGSQHIKNTLDKLGIKANIHQIREYKSAAEMITRAESSPEARENKEWILNERWSMMTQAFKEDRGLTEEKIVELMNFALFTAPEAKAAGLVDGVLYWDELENMLKGKEKELRTVSQATYADVKPEKLGLKGSKKIAVVHANGMIGGRKSRIDPMLGVMMGHESVIAELRRAKKDKNVAAIVFRVDSHGGESLASDLIGHEVEMVSKEKPVVVSMVDVAASGGYYIAYEASKLVADPMTITGSIGSISAKFNMKGLYDKLGITFDFIEKGPNALFYSDYADFTPEQRTRFEENHWAGFDMWLKDVAEHRKMSYDEITKLALGRVWTGRQAKANGLIDEVGGLDKAIEIAKDLAKIPADQKVTVVHYPKKKGLLQALLGGEGGGLTAAANWAIYRYIRDDVAETWNTLSARNLYMPDEAAVK